MCELCASPFRQSMLLHHVFPGHWADFLHQQPLGFQLIFIERCEYRRAMHKSPHIFLSIDIVMEIGMYFFFFSLCGDSCYEMPCKNRISIFYFRTHIALLLPCVQSIILLFCIWTGTRTTPQSCEYTRSLTSPGEPFSLSLTFWHWWIAHMIRVPCVRRANAINWINTFTWRMTVCECVRCACAACMPWNRIATIHCSRWHRVQRSRQRNS